MDHSAGAGHSQKRSIAGDRQRLEPDLPGVVTACGESISCKCLLFPSPRSAYVGMSFRRQAMGFELTDRHGRSVAYSPDGEHIYTWAGRPIAFLVDNRVHAFSGRFIGWFEDGWLRDRGMRCVAFTRAAIGGPVRPIRAVPSVKNVRSVRPVRGVPSVPPVKPARSLSWGSSFDELIEA